MFWQGPWNKDTSAKLPWAIGSREPRTDSTLILFRLQRAAISNGVLGSKG